MHKSNVILDHIVNFTAQRDEDLLAFSLLKSVQSMLSPFSSSILKLDSKQNPTHRMTYRADACTSEDRNIKISPEITKSIEYLSDTSFDEYSFQDEEKYYYIRLLHYSKKFTAYLILELPTRLDKVQTFMLKGMLDIFDNFTSLLLESQTDELTGLGNRKTFDKAIAKVFAHSAIKVHELDNGLPAGEQRSHLEPRYWLALIDIDHFKNVNDEYGHLYGDEVLIYLSQLIKFNFRQQDLTFRFGGEEFVLILPNIGSDECRYVLKRFKNLVENTTFPNDISITISIGAVELKEDIFHVTLVDYADQALYYSKNNGRNKLTFFEDIISSGELELHEIKTGGIDLF